MYAAFFNYLVHNFRLYLEKSRTAAASQRLSWLTLPTRPFGSSHDMLTCDDLFWSPMRIAEVVSHLSAQSIRHIPRS